MPPSNSKDAPKKTAEANVPGAVTGTALRTDEHTSPQPPDAAAQQLCGVLISFGDTRCRRPCVINTEYCKIHQNFGDTMSSQKNQSPTSGTNLASQSASGNGKSLPRQRHSSLESKTETASPVDRKFPAIGYPEEARCQATTTRGRACLYVATKNSRYCNLHADFDVNPPSARRKQPTSSKKKNDMVKSKPQKASAKVERISTLESSSKQLSQASTTSTSNSKSTLPEGRTPPAIKTAAAKQLTTTKYFNSLVSKSNATASQESAGLSSVVSTANNQLSDDFAHTHSTNDNKDQTQTSTHTALCSGDGKKAKRVPTCGTHGCDGKVVANTKVVQCDMKNKCDSTTEVLQSNASTTAMATSANAKRVGCPEMMTDTKDNAPSFACTTPNMQNFEKQESPASSSCHIQLPTVASAEERDLQLTPNQNSSTLFSKKIKLPRQSSSNRSNTTAISSPKLTRGFLHTDTSLLRKPVKGEEHYSFWVKLWPHLVKVGWTFKSNSENDGFQFRSPPTEHAENGIFYFNVSKVLEVVEKMPTMSYYLTEMVLAETSQVEQGDENGSQDESVLMDIRSKSDELCTIPQGNKSKVQGDGTEENVGDGEVGSDERTPQSLGKPLSSIPYQHWMGSVVSIASKGTTKGITGKIIKTGSGWVTMENVDDPSLTFSRRASDLTVVKLTESAATTQFAVVVDMVGSEASISVANASEQTSSQKSKGKRKASSRSPTLVPSLQNLPRRTVQKPIRYEDHAMIERKKRSRTDSPPTTGDLPGFDMSTAGSDGGYSPYELLSSVPQSCWINRRVRVMAGPMKGRIGVTYKVHYGWVYVKIPTGGEDDEACRRAPDLGLVENGEVDDAEKVIAEVHIVPSISDSDKGTGKLLSSVPVQRWPGMLVKVKFGVWSGRYARILRSNNGWIHLSADLISDYRLIENYDTCRRAFELEIVDESSGTSDCEECVEATIVSTPPHEKKQSVRLSESVHDMDVEDVSVESVSSSATSSTSSPQRLSGFRMSSTPISPGSVRALVLGAKTPVIPGESENPYANKKIMIGSSYQVSMSSMPPMPWDTNGEPRQLTDHERLKSMSDNCMWDCNANINFEELHKLLKDFGLNDEAWIRSLVIEGLRKGEIDPTKYARSEIMTKRVGLLRVDLISDAENAIKSSSDKMSLQHGVGQASNTITQDGVTQKRRHFRILGASHAFHRKAKKAHLRATRYHNVTLSQMVNNTYKSGRDPVMQEAFENSGWADASIE